MNLINKIIKILPHSEILKADDICRLVVETGDDGGFNTTYKHDNYDLLAWHAIKEEIPGYIDDKIENYDYHVWYEFARIINE